ncbi:alpha-L-rhamnosidase C-terminal domain-containing protein [Streptomyces sp. GbtcB7]|uniref:alpha-L-rhamnosidase C-terminal domain-containing protein n=1 Tax=Streptomyces sp. GbtcB7 TaxID=2824752 RepID=UPI0020C63538|nr:alpha-L-rhamnosidase C-terminal domain-containing protein [Streptomyces sp. GbtcB7]
MRRAAAEHHCPYGRIAAAWHLSQDGTFHLGVTVPAGTSAEVRLPDGTNVEVPPGRHEFTR